MADTAQELLRRIVDLDGHTVVDCTDEWADVMSEARAYLNATPEPAAGPTDDELLETLDKATAEFCPRHPEAEPLSAVEYPRELEIRKARAVLSHYAHQPPQPIPLSERLPGAEDCDADGQCWCFHPGDESCTPFWWFGTRQPGYTHWLPSPALPLPEAQS